MAAVSHIAYFLGANSPSGFYSLYPQLIPPESARAIYILKGGPGCGKSTLMRRVAEEMDRAGIEQEYILCSGDPESLDALLLPQLKIALVDGTAPHIVEPKYPGAVERYINLGECYDANALWERREELMASMTGYKGCYQRAYRCLEASAEIFEDIRATLLTKQLSDKLAKRAGGILSRELRKKKGVEAGRVKQRFLGAVTHKGLMCLYDTALTQCPRIYELSDSYGLAHELLVHLLAGATTGGWDVVACPDPMAPERLSHLLVPEKGIAFLTTGPGLSLPKKPYRRVRLDAAVEENLLRRSRPQIRFAKKVSSALMEEAISCLDQAKCRHDALENIYNPYVDFQQVEETAKKVADEILAMI